MCRVVVFTTVGCWAGVWFTDGGFGWWLLVGNCKWRLVLLIGWFLLGRTVVGLLVGCGLMGFGWWFLVGIGGGWLGCELNLAMN